MEDWDLPETPDTDHHPTGTAAEHTENWDDDFEVETRNNSPRKPKLSTPRRRDVREESWDDELEMEAKRDDLDAEFGRRDEEDRTVTARSRRAALSRFAPPNPSPPPPMPFFPSNNQHPSPEPFPRSPTASVFSVPNTIYTYSSSTPLVYGSHPRPMSSLALLPPSPPIHKERERRRLRKKSRPLREGTIELVDMAGRYSFSDGEGLPRNTRSATPSDVSSVDERHQHHRVLEPTPPLPTQPSVLAMPSAPVMTASGSTMTMPATPTKGGVTLMSRIGSVKKWGVRRRRGTSSTPSEIIGRLFFLLFNFFSSHFLIYHSFHQPNRNHKMPPTVLLVQEPPCRLLRVNYQHHRRIPQLRTVLPPQQTPIIRIPIGFFELPVALAVQALLPRVQDQVGGIASVTINRGGARAEAGREIEMLEIPMLGREHRRLRDGPR